METTVPEIMTAKFDHLLLNDHYYLFNIRTIDSFLILFRNIKFNSKKWMAVVVYQVFILQTTIADLDF